SHHYGNFEGLLEPLPPGRWYFTVGNLNQGNSVELPAYVVRPRREYAGTNRDRIIFSVRQQNTQWQWQRIDRVYITQHYDTVEHQGTAYDPRYTYQVTTNLLRQIREFSVGENQDNSLSELRDHFGSNADDLELRDIRNIWGELAPLGLLLFIVIKEKYFPIQRTKTPKQQQQQQQQQQINQNKRKPQPDFVVTIPENRQNHTRPLWTLATLLQDQTTDIKLEVTTGTNGKARIVWGNVPRDRLKDRVMVVLFKNNEDQEARTYECIGDRESGSCDTSVPLNDGLQARLHKVRVWWCFWKQVGEEICRGAEFKNPQAVLITGYN
uniref:uncharacterized protein LOC109954171 n=1 Tax=Monopterus albus TaxID=43700 RepID=UPI0009B32FDA